MFLMSVDEEKKLTSKTPNVSSCASCLFSCGDGDGEGTTGGVRGLLMFVSICFSSLLKVSVKNGRTTLWMNVL